MVEPWPIEIDGLPINSMVIFHGYVSHNQGVYIHSGKPNINMWAIEYTPIPSHEILVVFSSFLMVYCIYHPSMAIFWDGTKKPLLTSTKRFIVTPIFHRPRWFLKVISPAGEVVFPWGIIIPQWGSQSSVYQPIQQATRETWTHGMCIPNCE